MKPWMGTIYLLVNETFRIEISMFGVLDRLWHWQQVL